MGEVLELTSLRDCTLWKQLKDGFTETKHKVYSDRLAENLVQICEEASERMKAFPSLHPQYTLHDQTHLLRVTELMAYIIPDEVLHAVLNPIELAMLILAAHFHDQGMVLDSHEIDQLSSEKEFQLFRANWELDHPNLKQVRQQLAAKNLSETQRHQYQQVGQELEAALLTDFVRKTHGHRSANFVRTRSATDKRWAVAQTNLAEYVAKICQSHTEPARNLTPANGFNYDESIGPYQVNMPYLGLVLRLADILDFDRERTPDELYKSIHFSSSISLAEWEKHRSVEGWTIAPNMIRFTMQCEHPVYQRAAHRFMDWIDEELKAANEQRQLFPAPVVPYQLILPAHVDRTRIQPKDNKYIYHDLEFSLSRDEVVKLFLTDDLYGSPALCIRELLQNALDALRHRQALIKRDLGTDWTLGKVRFEHFLDEHGFEVVRCIDNGVGMDEAIVTRFLTRVGRSYYRSPEFEQERNSLAHAGADFDPCAQFGIGFMSCFMLGDHIIIQTRRDYGPKQGQGAPLIVEINGLDSMLVIRPGSPDQEIGTTVAITARNKFDHFMRWDDRIQLLQMLRHVALACEFPIEAHRDIPNLDGTLTIPPGIVSWKTRIEEEANIAACETFEQDFAIIDTRMRGSIRTSMLIDGFGKPTLGNTEAAWQNDEQHGAVLVTGDTKIIANYASDDGRTCMDGILVCGGGGFNKKEPLFYISTYPNAISLGNDPSLLDVRGTLKPPLTPARFPPPGRGLFNEHGPRWSHLQFLANLARGRLWEKIAEQMGGEQLDSDTFLQLAAIYRMIIPWMRAEKIWSWLSVPLSDQQGRVTWSKTSELDTLYLSTEDKGFELSTKNGKVIAVPEQLKHWAAKYHGDNYSHDLKWLVFSMSTITQEDGKPCLVFREPTDPEKAPYEYALGNSASGNPPFLLPYIGKFAQALTAVMPVMTGNRNHALAFQALEHKYDDPDSEIGQFAISAISTLSLPENCPSLADPLQRVTWGLRHLGYLYRKVDWSQYTKELHPPYSIWLDGNQEVTVTSEDLERWADVPGDQAIESSGRAETEP